MRPLVIAAVVIVAASAASCDEPVDALSFRPSAHSSTMALAADGATLFVVNPECDSVAEVDVAAHTLRREILLAGKSPSADSNGTFTPAVEPRALVLAPDGKTLYVTGERSGALYAIDVASGSVRGSVPVGSEPVGALVSGDGRAVFVAVSNDDAVVRVETASLSVGARIDVGDEPWALASSPDGVRLVVSHFLGAGIDEIDPTTMKLTATAVVPDVAPRGDRRLAHGQPRGFYDVAARPGSSELWTVHSLLGTDTAQPDLDFESTAFPALSVLDARLHYRTTLTTDAQDVDGIDGAIADVVSGPHALAFTADGAFAFVADANSNDLLVVDASTGVESSLVRPLPGIMPDGLVLSADESHVFVDERLSGDIAVLRLDRSSGAPVLTVDGPPIARWTTDPMPAELRLGERLFESADSTEFPITTNHWVACATCHLEERSDAVTWKFTQGPRDTPSNAGGTLGTGFLFRTADRTTVRDYWHTIDVEQGGSFDPNDPYLSSLLDALTAYVDHAVPLPVPPTTDPAVVAKGARIFDGEGCNNCHAGPRFTDSGSGNPDLDLTGRVVLHDVGTCVTSGFPDVAHEDVDGDPRSACAFDTPSLSGVASSPPYMHDGSAATLRDAADVMITKQGLPPLTKEDEDALVEYLESL